jgi:hypothetical protein
MLFRTRNNARVLGENFREYHFRIFAKITCKNKRIKKIYAKTSQKILENIFAKITNIDFSLSLLNLSARNHFCENIEMTYYSGRFSQEFLFQRNFRGNMFKIGANARCSLKLVFLHKIVNYFSR